MFSIFYFTDQTTESAVKTTVKLEYVKPVSKDMEIIKDIKNDAVTSGKEKSVLKTNLNTNPMTDKITLTTEEISGVSYPSHSKDGVTVQTPFYPLDDVVTAPTPFYPEDGVTIQTEQSEDGDTVRVNETSDVYLINQTAHTVGEGLKLDVNGTPSIEINTIVSTTHEGL